MVPYEYGQFVMPLVLTSISYIAPDVTNDKSVVSKLLGREGEHLLAWHASYSFDECHLRVRTKVVLIRSNVLILMCVCVCVCVCMCMCVRVCVCVCVCVRVCSGVCV
jgi:hypothetical protein